MFRFSRRQLGIVAGMITAVALTAGALISLSSNTEIVPDAPRQEMSPAD